MSITSNKVVSEPLVVCEMRQMERFGVRAVTWKVRCNQNNGLAVHWAFSVYWRMQRLYEHTIAVSYVTAPTILDFLFTSSFLYLTQSFSSKRGSQQFLSTFCTYFIFTVSCPCFITTILNNFKCKSRYKGKRIDNFKNRKILQVSLPYLPPHHAWLRFPTRVRKLRFEKQQG